MTFDETDATDRYTVYDIRLRSEHNFTIVVTASLKVQEQADKRASTRSILGTLSWYFDRLSTTREAVVKLSAHD